VGGEWSVFSVRAVKKINLHHQFITQFLAGRQVKKFVFCLRLLWTAPPKKSRRGLTHQFEQKNEMKAKTMFAVGSKLIFFRYFISKL
jgi:hypothetical protein